MTARRPDRPADKTQVVNEIVDEITKQLIDQGRLIEAGWQALRLAILPPTAPEVQLVEMRKAFFSGALHVLSSIMAAARGPHGDGGILQRERGDVVPDPATNIPGHRGTERSAIARHAVGSGNELMILRPVMLFPYVTVLVYTAINTVIWYRVGGAMAILPSMIFNVAVAVGISRVLDRHLRKSPGPAAANVRIACHDRDRRGHRWA